jgi:nitrogen regulatory protein PII 2
MLIVVVPDAIVPRVVSTIIDVNQTGNPGDGKIFVMPVTDTVRLRTGECDNAALDESAD